ncbi:calcium-dependent phosphotriesterase [Ramicandelaber brevisporus]|nr:calcium-dependent phosphotriesterase [Ramicandelaber brevisporus]
MGYKLASLSFLSVAALLLAVFWPSLKPTWMAFNVLDKFESHNLDKCARIGADIPGFEGCEDIDIHHSTGTMYLACGSQAERRRFFPPAGIVSKAYTAGHKDAVFAFNPRTSVITRLELPVQTSEFRAHGIGVIEDPEDPEAAIVMLVNHYSPAEAASLASRTGDNRTEVTAIEIYRHVPNSGKHQLEHLETIQHPLLRHANSILPLSRRSFYATIDVIGTPHTPQRILELAALKKSGYIVYRNDLGEISVALPPGPDSMPYPNGITADPQLRNIYVASSSGHAIHIFDRNAYTGALSRVGVIDTGKALPDNIRYDPTSGAIYAAGFLKPLQFLVLALMPHRSLTTSPWGVYKFTRQDTAAGEGWVMHDLVIDGKGELASTVSIAAPIPGTNAVMVGAVLDRAIHVCQA